MTDIRAVEYLKACNINATYLGGNIIEVNHNNKTTLIFNFLSSAMDYVKSVKIGQ